MYQRTDNDRKLPDEPYGVKIVTWIVKMDVNCSLPGMTYDLLQQ